MSWIGKIAGAFIGYLLFRNVFGALLGGMLGHFLDTGLLRPVKESEMPLSPENSAPPAPSAACKNSSQSERSSRT